MGRPDFMDSAHICVIQKFLGISIRSAENNSFTCCIQLDTLQNKFLTENAFVPSLACDQSIFCDTYSYQIQHF